jgi:aspartyl-tRNA(Asn)/glutamyl-tRNA(Gln) amidotransferase subunit A
LNLQVPKYPDLGFIRAEIASGNITLPQVVQYYLDRIALNLETNAYIEVWEKEALERAQDLQEKWANSSEPPPPLFGAVLSLKDNILYEGHEVNAASKILEGYQAIYTATAVQRLLDAGAILIGRTNCDQFGMGSSNENTVFGPVKNALDLNRSSGGSTGGGAVSVQIESCLAAIGSDTGGSVRQPAAFCGVMGFKPTYGRISRYGLIAYASSFDQIGIIAKNTTDIQCILQVMAGADPLDATSASVHLQSVDNKIDVSNRKYKIAYIPEALDAEGLDPAIRHAAYGYLERKKQAGHQVAAVTFPYLKYIVQTYYILTTAEASSNLARYDGVRFGYRNTKAKTTEEMFIATRSEGFSTEVKRRILLGTFVLSSSYYDAYYTKAQQSRRLIRDAIMAIFKDHDFILLPTAPSVAWPIGQKQNDPVATYLADIFTVIANLAGVPALAFPEGAHPENQMPIGLQMMAAPWQENALLAMCR